MCQWAACNERKYAGKETSSAAKRRRRARGEDAASRTPIHKRLGASERIPRRTLLAGVRGERVDLPERHRGAQVFGAGDGEGAVACGGVGGELVCMLEMEGMSGGGVRMKSNWEVGGVGRENSFIGVKKIERGRGASKVWSGEGK